jgi:hypothetical protein
MRLLAFLLASGSIGVTVASAQVTIMSGAVSRTVAGPGPSSRQSVPHSLIRMRTVVQTLGNGSQITNRTETREWLDAEGRTRMEVRVEQNGRVVDEVTELHREAPDPGMFEPPPEYLVFVLTRDPVKP